MKPKKTYFLFCIWLSIVCHAQQAIHGAHEQANDFTYTTASGKTGTLYALEAETLLLYFYDPTCEDCHALMHRLDSLYIINQRITEGRLKVLAIYPEEDTDEWQEQDALMPPAWINGYDKDAKIFTEGLFPLVKLPALYLLDREKRFILKDTSPEAIERKLEKTKCNL